MIKEDDQGVTVNGRSLPEGFFETHMTEAVVGADGLWSDMRQYPGLSNNRVGFATYTIQRNYGYIVQHARLNVS